MAFSAPLVPASAGAASIFEAKDESPLPRVAPVRLEYPESLNSSRLVSGMRSLPTSGLERLAATLADWRVSGTVV